MKRLIALVALVATLMGGASAQTAQSFDKFNSVVYELNIRQATEEGTFAAAEKYLPELKAMGVDIVWLMPISPIGVDGRKGTLGSYYSIIDYKAINPEFGTMKDFKHFLATAHDLGLKVIIDWVANHTSRDAKWWKQGKKDWYVIDEKTGLPIVEYDWTDIAKLNYKNQKMRAAMLDALKFWIKLGVDGYRCDVAMNVPADFWKGAWEEVRKINPEFGTMEDFDHFLATAHELGLKVIIDWVANHTSRDANWWKEGKKDWYVMDEKTGVPIVEYDWTDIAKLNYKNEDMRAAMLDAIKFWIEKGVDGYRCDVAMNVPADFWKKAWEEVRKINPDVYLLAEGEETWLHESGFDATYAWELHHIFNAMAKGGSETKNVAGDGTIKTNAKTVKDLKEYMERDDQKYPAPAMRLMFTSNHDENSWAGTEFERMGDAHKALAALTFVMPKSQPLIYTGQEIALSRRLQFFEKDSVKELVDLEYGKEYRNFYRTLCSFRHANKALAAGAEVAPAEFVEGVGENVLAFSRQKEDNTVLCLFNFSAEPTTVTLTEAEAGDYTCACGEAKSFKAGDTVELAAWGFMLLAK